MAESTEVKAFYREGSNQKGRSKRERNRRRKSQRCSCQVSASPGRWLLSLWKKLRDTHKGATGGLKAAILERTAEKKARKVCEPVRMTLRMTKTVPITEKGNGKEVCRLADEVGKWGSQDMINLVERGPLGSGETAGIHPPDSVLGYGC